MARHVSLRTVLLLAVFLSLSAAFISIDIDPSQSVRPGLNTAAVFFNVSFDGSPAIINLHIDISYVNDSDPLCPALPLLSAVLGFNCGPGAFPSTGASCTAFPGPVNVLKSDFSVDGLTRDFPPFCNFAVNITVDDDGGGDFDNYTYISIVRPEMDTRLVNNGPDSFTDVAPGETVTFQIDFFSRSDAPTDFSDIGPRDQLRNFYSMFLDLTHDSCLSVALDLSNLVNVFFLGCSPTSGTTTRCQVSDALNFLPGSDCSVLDCLVSTERGPGTRPTAILHITLDPSCEAGRSYNVSALSLFPDTENPSDNSRTNPVKIFSNQLLVDLDWTTNCRLNADSVGAIGNLSNLGISDFLPVYNGTASFQLDPPDLFDVTCNNCGNLPGISAGEFSFFHSSVTWAPVNPFDILPSEGTLFMSWESSFDFNGFNGFANSTECSFPLFALATMTYVSESTNTLIAGVVNQISIRVRNDGSLDLPLDAAWYQFIPLSTTECEWITWNETSRDRDNCTVSAGEPGYLPAAAFPGTISTPGAGARRVGIPVDLYVGASLRVSSDSINFVLRIPHEELIETITFNLRREISVSMAVTCPATVIAGRSYNISVRLRTRVSSAFINELSLGGCSTCNNTIDLTPGDFEDLLVTDWMVPDGTLSTFTFSPTLQFTPAVSNVISTTLDSGSCDSAVTQLVAFEINELPCTPSSTTLVLFGNRAEARSINVTVVYTNTGPSDLPDQSLVQFLVNATNGVSSEVNVVSVGSGGLIKFSTTTVELQIFFWDTRAFSNRADNTIFFLTPTVGAVDVSVRDVQSTSCQIQFEPPPNTPSPTPSPLVTPTHSFSASFSITPTPTPTPSSPSTPNSPSTTNTASSTPFDFSTTISVGGSDDTIIIGDSDNDTVVVIRPNSNLPSDITVDVGSSEVSTGGVDIGGGIIDISGSIDGEIELCFWVEATSRDARLGYYDEGDDCWEVEDNDLEEEETREVDGRNETLLCGTTDHFTSFAVLLGDGESGTGGICESSDDNTFAILMASLGVALFIVFLAGLVVILFLYFKPFKFFVLGSEGTRIEKLRHINPDVLDE